ncbi:hypothetical protein [Kitasatospora sp. NPDC093558]
MLGPLLNAPPDFRELAFETGLSVLIDGFRDILNNLRAQHGC